MNINEIIQESITLEKSMIKKLDNPDGLSHAIAMQGNYRALLGNYLARLERDTALLKGQIKFEEAKKKKEILFATKLAVNKAELELDSDEEVKARRDELIQKEYQTNLIKIKRDDIRTAMDGYRSRLAFIRQEIQ